MKSKLILFLAILVFSLPARAAPNVVTSIKPVHSLVAAVMEGVGAPTLIVRDKQSVHGYQMKPSQLKALQNADVVFYISPQLETFLAKPLDSLPEHVRKVPLIEASKVTVLKVRGSGIWNANSQTAADLKDPHIWLDPENARMMVRLITKQLKAADPKHRALYERNSCLLSARLTQLNKKLRENLSDVKFQPFIVYHDAFQYFENKYKLFNIGAVTNEPDQEPGAQTLAAFYKKAQDNQVKAIFSDPHINTKLVQTITEGSPIKTCVLDESGMDLPQGPELYFSLMQDLANEFIRCLGQPGAKPQPESEKKYRPRRY